MVAIGKTIRSLRHDDKGFAATDVLARSLAGEVARNISNE
jgi:ABC-type siderophore export system fused ATPase/permease subunit